MAKYRKKLVEIEAFQYDGDLKGSDGNYYVPDWAVRAFEENVMYYDILDMDCPCELFIKTSEGTHHVSVGDYVIQDVNGELYPCKPDIFEKAYESVDVNSGCKKCENIQTVLDKIEPDVEYGRYAIVTAKLFNEIASLLESSRRADENKEKILFEIYSFEIKEDLG